MAMHLRMRGTGRQQHDLPHPEVPALAGLEGCATAKGQRKLSAFSRPSAHMKMQMFAVLISSQIGENSAFAFLNLNLACDLAHHGQHRRNNLIVALIPVCERWNMFLRNHNDVQWPKWLGVVIGQHKLILIFNAKRSFVWDRDVAIEISSNVVFHGAYLTSWFRLGNPTTLVIPAKPEWSEAQWRRELESRFEQMRALPEAGFRVAR